MRYFISVFVVFLSFNLFANDNARLGIGAGVWGVFDDADVHAVHIDYELPKLKGFYGLQPIFSVFKAEQGYNYYGSGFTMTFQLDSELYWGVGSQLGIVDRPRGLGHKVEFYSRIFLENKISNDWLIRFELGHISNAGLGDLNPGSESFVISIVKPL
ncbi:acyloxyacyl hydrolase [Pseudoalteromonas rubra]|uniref:Deacylase n=1 Tax=Pseudoalteromonas rubra TaxID=43658 RepID=A0A0U2PCM1_9GAMM|nr:acyloxyacyl hydrolase [Pseudoalteromonas rubra]ALU44909.1 hypothetical protein AT705_19305 [Pseudoalteromonas rubra]